MTFIIEALIILAMVFIGDIFPENGDNAVVGILVLIAIDIAYISYRIDKIIKDEE